jgi:Leucine-rich repeat (LRR) protein
MTKLQGLYLNNNSFTKGPLPDVIGNLVNLQYLNLQGAILLAICPDHRNLTKLMIFNISTNEFTG